MARYRNNSSKVIPCDPKTIEKVIDTSLRTLNIDAIDIAFLYDVGWEKLNNEEYIKKLIDIKKKGKIKFYGIFAYPETLKTFLPKTLELNIFDAYLLQHSLAHSSQKVIDTLTQSKKFNNLPSFWYFLRQLRRSTRLIDINGRISSHKNLRQMFIYFIKKYHPKSGITNPVQESLSFCLQNEKIHSTMINTCDEKHLMENLQLLD